MDETTIANAEEFTKQLRECWRLEDENKDLRSSLTAMEKKLNLLENCRVVLEHAVELGYFSEGGSTDVWAKEVLAASKYRE